MKHSDRLLLAAGLLFCIPLDAAQAAGLRLSPLRLDLSAQQTATQVELTNLSAAPVAVQVKAFRWSQEQGQDVYEPTKDIFFAPPIVTVPGQGKTVVRFRLRAAAPKDREGTYRIYFQEVPPANESASGAGMTFRVRFGVPLFVAPGKVAQPGLSVKIARESEHLRLTLENTGAAHLKIQGVDLFPAGVNTEQPDQAPLASATHSLRAANYLLSGSRHEWELKLPEAATKAATRLLIRTDDYSGQAAHGMTPQGWLWLPVDSGGAPAAKR